MCASGELCTGELLGVVTLQPNSGTGDRLTVLKVAFGTAVADSRTNPTGYAWDHIVVQMVLVDPSVLVQLRLVKADALLVVAQGAAVEEKQQLVALVLVGRPVNGDQSARLAVKTKFFRNLSLAGGGGRFPLLNVAPRDIPRLLVGGMDQEHST